MPSPTRRKGRKLEGVGHVIVCGSRAVRIERALGSGECTDVYKVHLTTEPDKKYALKTERYDSTTDERKKRLKAEIAFFEALKVDWDNSVDKSRLPQMHLTGRTPEYRFLITTLLGPTLADVRTWRRRTSKRTVAEIAVQTLRAIEALHELGWLSRAVEPHNFAVGLPPNDATIYMRDFARARQYRDEDGKLIEPRRRPHRRATSLYASTHALQGEELSRRDDLESWCYMMLEYFNRHNMIWREVDRRQAVAMKNNVLMHSAEMRMKTQLQLPVRFSGILKIIGGLSFTADPSYAWMRAEWEEIVREEKIDMAQPLDWAGVPLEDEDEEHGDSPVEKSAERRRQQRALERKRQRLERALYELYKLVGAPKTKEELRVELLMKVGNRRANKRSHSSEEARAQQNEESHSDRSEDRNDSEGDRGHRIVKKSRGRGAGKRSPVERPPEESDNHEEVSARSNKSGKGSTWDEEKKLIRDLRKILCEKTEEERDSRDDKKKSSRKSSQSTNSAPTSLKKSSFSNSKEEKEFGMVEAKKRYSKKRRESTTEYENLHVLDNNKKGSSQRPSLVKDVKKGKDGSVQKQPSSGGTVSVSVDAKNSGKSVAPVVSKK